MKQKLSGDDDIRFLREAIVLAKEHSYAGAGGPFGAVIVREGIILGRGWNQVISANDPTAHAEIIAIREACRGARAFHLHGAVLYTSCEPCPMCLMAACWAHVARIVFAADRNDAAAIGFDDARLYEQISRRGGCDAFPQQQLLR